MPITINQIKALMEKATGGEWKQGAEMDSDGDIMPTHEIHHEETRCSIAMVNRQADLSLFLALPSIAQICIEQAAELDKLRKQRARCLEVCYDSDGMEICKNCGLE